MTRTILMMSLLCGMLGVSPAAAEMVLGQEAMTICSRIDHPTAAETNLEPGRLYAWTALGPQAYPFYWSDEQGSIKAEGFTVVAGCKVEEFNSLIVELPDGTRAVLFDYPFSIVG